MNDISDDGASVDQRVRADALERRIAELQATHTARIIHTELKAEAVRQGIVDLDGLKLVDPKDIAVGDNGEVSGAATLIREFKRAKPWLFGIGSTSSTAAPPQVQQPRQKTARDMSHAEWQAARSELIKRR